MCVRIGVGWVVDVPAAATGRSAERCTMHSRVRGWKRQLRSDGRTADVATLEAGDAVDGSPDRRCEAFGTETSGPRPRRSRSSLTGPFISAITNSIPDRATESSSCTSSSTAVESTLGFDSRSVTKPSRRRLPSMWRLHIIRARSPASATARSGSPRARVRSARRNRASKQP